MGGVKPTHYHTVQYTHAIKAVETFPSCSKVLLYLSSSIIYYFADCRSYPDLPCYTHACFITLKRYSRTPTNQYHIFPPSLCFILHDKPAFSSAARINITIGIIPYLPCSSAPSHSQYFLLYNSLVGYHHPALPSEIPPLRVVFTDVTFSCYSQLTLPSHSNLTHK